MASATLTLTASPGFTQENTNRGSNAILIFLRDFQNSYSDGSTTNTNQKMSLVVLQSADCNLILENLWICGNYHIRRWYKWGVHYSSARHEASDRRSVRYSIFYYCAKKVSVLFSCFFHRAVRRDGPLDLTTIQVHNAVDSYNYNSTF